MKLTLPEDWRRQLRDAYQKEPVAGLERRFETVFDRLETWEVDAHGESFIGHLAAFMGESETWLSHVVDSAFTCGCRYRDGESEWCSIYLLMSAVASAERNLETALTELRRRLENVNQPGES